MQRYVYLQKRTIFVTRVLLKHIKTNKALTMVIKNETRSIYETPQAEELVLKIEAYLLSEPRIGGGEKLYDEEQAGF